MSVAFLDVMSATFVIQVDDSTVIIFVSIATTACKSSIPRSQWLRVRCQVTADLEGRDERGDKT